MGRLPRTQRQKAMAWQPMSSSTPPPERRTSQNQGACGPACFSLCLTRTTSPSAPSSTSCLARTYFGAKNSSSAYISFTPASRQAAIIASASSKCQAERLLADDVLAGMGGVDADLRVQVVRHPDGHHVEIVALQHLSIVGEVMRDTELIGQGAATLGTWRGDGDDLGIRHMRKGLGVQVSDEPGADDADVYAIPVSHCHRSSTSPRCGLPQPCGLCRLVSGRAYHPPSRREGDEFRGHILTRLTSSTRCTTTAASRPGGTHSGSVTCAQVPARSLELPGNSA